MEIISMSEGKAENILTVLRAETALSRFPLHLLTSSQNVQIELQNQSGAVYWGVSYNSKYGPPGQLAYKIDTLLVNRRIEEAGRHIPEVIRLGSLPEISRELEIHTRNWKAIRQALFQNASAFITAKIVYRSTDGTEKWLEAGFTRYQIILAGEALPNGVRADAVYIVLNSVYREVLNNAVFRPLDYDYMKTLPPIAQRFYEIISYQIYAALKHKNPRARLLYSDYCAYSTAKRYFDFDHVKKQMYKVLRPHGQSGYIAKTEYQETINERGEIDWWMYYTPGPNAAREYRAFTGQGQIRKITKRGAKKESQSQETPDANPALPFGDSLPVAAGKQPAVAVPAMETETPPKTLTPPTSLYEAANQTSDLEELQELVTALTVAELNRSDAERFAREKPEECRRQLEFLPHVREFTTSRGAYLRRAIEEGYGPPKSYTQEQAHQASLEATRRKRGAAALQAAERVARQSHEERCSEPYWDYVKERVGEAEKTQPEAFMAFQEKEASERARLTTGPFAGRPITQKALEVFDGEANRWERARDFWQAHGVAILNFWEWDTAQNPEPFQF